MDVALLWFQCKEKDCNYIPLQTKKDKIKRAWRFGESITKCARQRLFMRYVEGNYVKKDNGDVIIFYCKYGDITLLDMHASLKEVVNGYYNPIKDKESCGVCIQRIKNEGALFQ